MKTSHLIFAIGTLFATGHTFANTLPDQAAIESVEKALPPLPQKPPYGSNWQVVDQYNQELVQWLKNNQSSFDARAFTEMTTQLSTLRSQDVNCSDQSKLNQLIDEDTDVVKNPPKYTPDQVQAYQILQDAQAQAAEITGDISSVVAPIDSTTNLLAICNKAIPQFQSEVGSITDPSIQSEVADQIKLLTSQCSSASSELDKLTSPKSQLLQDEDDTNSILSQLASLEELIQGKDTQSDDANLKKMQDLQQQLDSLQQGVKATAAYANSDVQALGANANQMMSSAVFIEKYLKGPTLPKKGLLYVDVTYITTLLGQVSSVDEFKEKLHAWFMQLQAQNVDTIILAFGQIDNILELSQKQAPHNSASDLVCDLLHNNSDDFNALIEQAHTDYMKVIVSFGGILAQNADWTLEPAGSLPNPAQTLAQVVSDLNLDGIDFDAELTTFNTTDPEGRTQTMLDDLHPLLAKSNKPVSIASQGAIATWPKGDIKDFFYRGDDCVFNARFDGLNLMLYSDTAPYIDPDDRSTGWALVDWLDLIGKENASKVRIGFDDSVNYRIGPYANCSSNGMAAAKMYKDALKKIGEDGYPNSFGPVFFWPALNLNPYTALPMLPSFLSDFARELGAKDEVESQETMEE